MPGGYFSSLAHFWLATVQEVLHADWQLAWHSPQAVYAPDLMQGCWTVSKCFIFDSSKLNLMDTVYNVLPYSARAAVSRAMVISSSVGITNTRTRLPGLEISTSSPRGQLRL